MTVTGKFLQPTTVFCLTRMNHNQMLGTSIFH